jgi:hypothetical protein
MSKNNRYENLHFECSKGAASWLRELAEKKGISLSSAIRLAVEEAMSRDLSVLGENVLVPRSKIDGVIRLLGQVKKELAK